MAAARVLDPAVVTRLQRLRLGGRSRVEGRYAGAHLSRRHGASLDFADHREYVAGDDLRRIDAPAYARLGRVLVKLYEAEDEAALRVVVDLSASMGFGGKLTAAREVAAALTVVASAGGDRVRVLLAGAVLDPGPWYRGATALPAVEARLLTAGAGGTADLPAALHRAVAEGPRGPTVCVSDLLFDGWRETVDRLALGRADTALVHLVGRADLEPDLDGDLRLVDVETGAAVEVAGGAAALAGYAAARDRWLADVERACGARGVVYARLVDDEPVEQLVGVRLPAAGLVA